MIPPVFLLFFENRHIPLLLTTHPNAFVNYSDTDLYIIDT